MRSKIFILSTIIILSSCTLLSSNQIQNTKPVQAENKDVKNSLTLNTTKNVEITILNPKDKSSVSWYKKDEENIVMKVGSQAELIGTVTLNNGTKSSNVNWSSSDNTIALVNNGKITTNKIGTTSILAISSVDPSYKRILNVTVVDEANFSIVDAQSINKVKSIEAYVLTDLGKKQEVKLQVNSNIQSVASVTLIDGTKNSNVIWESSDENIAVVDSDGKITAKKLGFTTIVAKYKLNPDFKALINLEVSNKIDNTIIKDLEFDKEISKVVDTNKNIIKNNINYCNEDEPNLNTKYSIEEINNFNCVNDLKIGSTWEYKITTSTGSLFNIISSKIVNFENNKYNIENNIFSDDKKKNLIASKYSNSDKPLKYNDNDSNKYTYIGKEIISLSIGNLETYKFYKSVSNDSETKEYNIFISKKRGCIKINISHYLNVLPKKDTLTYVDTVLDKLEI